LLRQITLPSIIIFNAMIEESNTTLGCYAQFNFSYALEYHFNSGQLESLVFNTAKLISYF